MRPIPALRFARLTTKSLMVPQGTEGVTRMNPRISPSSSSTIHFFSALAANSFSDGEGHVDSKSGHSSRYVE